MHLRILPDHQNQVLKKLFVSPLEWLKTCFDAFAQSTKFKSFTSEVVEKCFLHLRILPDHQNQVLKKLFVSPLEWLKTCFDAYFHITRFKSLKNYFFHLWSGKKRVFYAFPGHQNQVLKYLFFHVWGGQKRVFMHLRILPYHQNQVLKKLFFSPLEW